MKFSIAIALGLSLAGSAVAESVNPKSSDPSVAAELASFTVHDEFEVNLFADETLGIANPIAMHWDERGRLWVLTTLAYAQLAPGQKPNDKIYILEDTDGDGEADESTVFAEGLDMPIGFALGESGVYLGEGDKLVFLPDKDGKAGPRQVLLRGFGTGDTHQNISNFNWGPDGRLYFSQGLHCYSRVETPWGIVRGDTAGFFRFDPDSLKLEPFCFPSMASQNPCGIAFDKHGSMFIKSNNKELIYVTPGLVPTTHSRNLVPIASIGATPGKSMGAEYVESDHLPDWLQHHILVSGYYSHRLTAFPLVEDGAGYRQVEPLELLVADHPSFRPVDSRIGPDGAIYVADWFNPIIGHYQASLRHPDRDKQHGRIWRITAKNRPLMENRPPRLHPGIAGEGKPPAIDDSPGARARQRLQEVIKLANLPEADSLPKALQALEHQPDRFTDYALRQSVHALAAYWLPAVSAGELEFSKPEHLAFALEEIGGQQAVTLARAKLADASIDAAVRQRFAAVLAKVGSAEDLRNLLMDDHTDDAVLNALNEAWATRKVRAAAPFVPRLAQLMASQNESVKSAALRLAGLWHVKPQTAMVKKIVLDPEESEVVRVQAMEAFARLAGKESVDHLSAVAMSEGKSSSGLRLGSVLALCLIDLQKAGTAAAEILPTLENDTEVGRLLQFFLNRKGGADALAIALQAGELTIADARRVSTSLSEVGRRSGKLAAVIDDTLGTAANATPYSAKYVSRLVAEVSASGNPEAGKEIFQRPLLTCVACHQISGTGGVLGPSLDTVGAGLPLDIIIESVLWPERQLKEGYFALSVTTKDGRELTGYKEREQAGVLYLRDTASGVTHPIPAGQIAERRNIGTLMPAGLTASLKRDELRDLIAYLATLKGGN